MKDLIIFHPKTKYEHKVSFDTKKGTYSFNGHTWNYKAMNHFNSLARRDLFTRLCLSHFRWLVKLEKDLTYQPKPKKKKKSYEMPPSTWAYFRVM